MIADTNIKGDMKDIKTINSLVISQYANCLREFLLRNVFYEVSLFDTTPFHVTNTSQIQTETGEFLRNTTEPEIWELGLNEDRFFSITSLFRKEDLKSLLHKNEFKIVDFYIKNTSEAEILNLFFQALDYLEEKLKLPHLSNKPLNICDHKEFSKLDFSSFEFQLFKVENYTIEESFYDVIDTNTGKSKKGELFFIADSKPIEFSVFGQADENKNPINKIENFQFKFNGIRSLNLFGMCLGIERTILCYEILKEYELINSKV